MASYNIIDDVFAPGMTTNNYAENDWAFKGNVSLDPVYEGNFEADIDAIAESIGDDSGYFSNSADSFEASNGDVSRYDLPASPFCESKPSVHSNDFYADVPASNKSNYGSIYHGTLTKSTTHLEKGTASRKQRKEARVSKTLDHPVYEYEHKTQHKYSTIEKEGPRPLDLWVKTHERHEWNAYQLEQPANPQSSKIRKTGGRK